MFDLIKYLKAIGELKGGKALDLGCGKGKLADELFGNLYEVTGVDRDVFDFPAGKFIQSDIRDFEIKKETYDLITARFVLPFLDSVAEMQKTIDRMYQGLKPGGIMCYNYLGTKDPKNPSKGVIFTDDCLKPKGGKDLYYSEAFYLSLKMNGELKNCHVYTFVMQKCNMIV